MKKLAITLLCMAPITSYAQYPMGMSEADMQNMMQQMQQAQACMERIDQAELKALENKANQFEAEMKSLCDSGKRDKAQEKAMVYMKEIVNSSAVKEAKRCGEIMKVTMQYMMQNMPLVDKVAVLQKQRIKRSLQRRRTIASIEFCPLRSEFDARILPTHIIGENEEDVGPLVGNAMGRRKQNRQQ